MRGELRSGGGRPGPSPKWTPYEKVGPAASPFAGGARLTFRGKPRNIVGVYPMVCGRCLPREAKATVVKARLSRWSVAGVFPGRDPDSSMRSAVVGGSQHRDSGMTRQLCGVQGVRCGGLLRRIEDARGAWSGPLYCSRCTNSCLIQALPRNKMGQSDRRIPQDTSSDDFRVGGQYGSRDLRCIHASSPADHPLARRSVLSCERPRSSTFRSLRGRGLEEDRQRHVLDSRRRKMESVCTSRRNRA
jgi:hypothetical protein